MLATGARRSMSQTVPSQAPSKYSFAQKSGCESVFEYGPKILRPADTDSVELLDHPLVRHAHSSDDWGMLRHEEEALPFEEGASSDSCIRR